MTSVSPPSTIGSLGIRMPEGLKSVEEVPEWEEIEMVVDSGASESVVSEDTLTRVTTVEGYAQKKGGTVRGSRWNLDPEPRREEIVGS